MTNVIPSVLRQPLRAVVLVAALLFVSCSTHYDNTEDLTPVSVQVAFEGFNLSTSSMSRAGETSTTIPDGINRLALTVFNGQGAEVASVKQKVGDTDFGSVNLKLIPGTYTFTCVLNAATVFGTTPLADVAPATIISPTQATIPGTVAHDTYCCCSQGVSISGSSATVSLNMGSRINSRFVLNVTDAVPSDVTTLAVIINPDATTPAGESLSINPATGLATSPTQYILTQDVATAPNQAQLEIYLPATEPGTPFTTSVRIEARNSSGDALYTHTIASVPFTSNTVTTATGRLFDSSASFSFTFVTDPWTSGSVIPF